MSKKLSPKISYDKESKVLSIQVKDIKSVDSDIHGNLVIDYDKKGEVARINLYKFTIDAFKEGAPALRSFSSNFINQ